MVAIAELADSSFAVLGQLFGEGGLAASAALWDEHAAGGLGVDGAVLPLGAAQVVIYFPLTIEVKCVSISKFKLATIKQLTSRFLAFGEGFLMDG